MPNEQNVTALSGLLEKVDRLKAELDALRPLSPEQEGRVMQKFRLDWNYHSNAIEGNSLTYGETIAFLMEGLTAKGKPFKDHLDIRGHNEAIDFLMDLVKNHQHLSEKIIRELHQMILVEPYATPAKTSSGQRVEKKVTLGAYKSMPNHVQTPTGEIHYYATPEETPAKMSDLMAWLREQQENEDLHPLAVAAIFHHRFVAIHPFDDGNGRMSRLLMNLLLLQYGYPPVVIKQQDRQAYYYALRQADAGEMEAFVEFIGENLVHSLEIYLRGARGESIEEMDDLKKRVELLKKVAEGKKEMQKRKKSEDVEDLAKWLEINTPPIRAEMIRCFSVFAEFFEKAEFEELWVREEDANEVKAPDWVYVATTVVSSRQSKVLRFGYRFYGFLYDESAWNILSSPSYIDVLIQPESITVFHVWREKEKTVDFKQNLFPTDLQPIRDLAQMFYGQIERAINK